MSYIRYTFRCCSFDRSSDCCAKVSRQGTRQGTGQGPSSWPHSACEACKGSVWLTTRTTYAAETTDYILGNQRLGHQRQNNTQCKGARQQIGSPASPGSLTSLRVILSASDASILRPFAHPTFIRARNGKAPNKGRSTQRTHSIYIYIYPGDRCRMIAQVKSDLHKVLPYDTKLCISEVSSPMLSVSFCLYSNCLP